MMMRGLKWISGSEEIIPTSQGYKYNHRKLHKYNVHPLNHGIVVPPRVKMNLESVRAGERVLGAW